MSYNQYMENKEKLLSPRVRELRREYKEEDKYPRQGSYTRQYNQGEGEKYSTGFRSFINRQRARRQTQAVEEEFIPGTGMLSRQGHNLSSLSKTYY